MTTQSWEGEYELRITVIFWVSKVEISWKLANKGDFGNVFDPI